MLSTGFNSLDTTTGGWHNGDLIVIASRPAMGKTSFLCSFLEQLSIKQQIESAFFSLEMTKSEVINRFMRLYSGFDKPEITQIINAPLWIDDTQSLSISEFKNRSMDLVQNKGVKLIALDYFQLITADRNFSSKEETKYICNNLKSIAEELNIPVIISSQLTRAIDRRADKRPNIADFEQNSYLADIADVVTFIYRQGFYEPLLYESHADQNAEIIVAKNVHGSIGTKNLAFIPYLCRFHDIDDPFKIKPDLKENSKNNMPMLIKDVL